MLKSKLAGVMVRVDGAHRRLATPLDQVQLAFLAAAGLDPRVFVTPSPPRSQVAR